MPFELATLGAGNKLRIEREIGLIRFAGTTLPAKGVRPEPSGLPVPGSYISDDEPLRLPAICACVGIVSRFVLA